MPTHAQWTRVRALLEARGALEGRVVHPSASALDPEDRATLIQSLNQVLCDGIDLYSHVKVAHWNIRGPGFGVLHPLFDSFSKDVSGFNDDIAERAVMLGGHVYATTAKVAEDTSLPEYPEDTVEDMEHVGNLIVSFEAYLESLRGTRGLSEDLDDLDTLDMLTGMITTCEKHVWFLLATRDKAL